MATTYTEGKVTEETGVVQADSEPTPVLETPGPPAASPEPPPPEPEQPEPSPVVEAPKRTRVVKAPAATTRKRTITLGKKKR